MSEIKIGVITASDRASAGIYEDISGMAIQETMKAYLRSEFEIEYRCIPDEQEKIEEQALEIYQRSPEEAEAFLTDHTRDCMEKVVELYRTLRSKLITTYTNNHEWL